MPNKNYAEVMGHLGKDPETRTTATGKSVTELSLATSNDYKGSDGNWSVDLWTFGRTSKTCRALVQVGHGSGAADGEDA